MGLAAKLRIRTGGGPGSGPQTTSNSAKAWLASDHAMKTGTNAAHSAAASAHYAAAAHHEALAIRHQALSAASS